MPTNKLNLPKMEEINSSTIESIGWGKPGLLDTKIGLLYVCFINNSSTYEYKNVHCDLFQLLVDASKTSLSMGRLFEYLIKKHPDKYPYKKLD